MTKDVFVFVEQRDGAIHPGAMQCLTAAAELAGKTEMQAVIAYLQGLGTNIPTRR